MFWVFKKVSGLRACCLTKLLKSPVVGSPRTEKRAIGREKEEAVLIGHRREGEENAPVELL